MVSIRGLLEVEAVTTDLDELEHRWNRNEPADVTYVWQFVDELIARLRAAEGIVRDLAAKDPLVFSDSSHPFIGSDYECGCCEAMAQSKYDVEHAESCPWRRATEYVK